MQTKVDHLVIAATDIDRGVDYAESLLGVQMPKGGVHEKMGTHNHLMQLGDALFLEVIAINPQGEPPTRPRWFGLDDPFVRARLDREPAFLAWVVNTDDIHTLMAQSAISLGRAESVSRGDLNWQFGLPSDGRLLAGGMIPYVIQWGTGEHPAARMADLGCRLIGLDIHHPYPEWIGAVLNSIGPVGMVQVHKAASGTPPYMTASIDTPAGIRLLSSRQDKGC
ncbi:MULTISPECIES: VOC family protein [unclassified Pseudodesulfovibrio]|uniref:VOC family protein n=1 Tax=unclassified Pseudodesulfovibrio TaxID=2661612 RepID=UPI0013E3DC06|nr:MULTISPECIES: VOC family protein [unclassified Pseudodesulfovibrio]MCJ2165981.1 VOC family protein [Pseudodesulfovibrio sp. S3-i]